MPKRKTSRVVDIPHFMHADLGKGTEAVSPDSTLWVGLNGEYDPLEVLRSQSLHFRTPLEIILEAIVAAHPGLGPLSRSERVEIARCALLGQTRARGHDLCDDDELIQKLADEVLRRVRRGERDPKVGPIIRRLTALQNPRLAGDLQQLDTWERRIRKKFNGNRDLLLARASFLEERPEFASMVRRVLQELSKLGVRSDLRSLF